MDSSEPVDNIFEDDTAEDRQRKTIYKVKLENIRIAKPKGAGGRSKSTFFHYNQERD